MISNLFRVGFRNLYENKFFSFVSVISLTLGFTICIFIAVYVYDETHHDAFHENAGSLYRVGLQAKFSGQNVKSAVSNPYLMKAMRSEIPGVIATTRILKNPAATPVTVKSSADHFTNINFLLADSNFFEFFSFKLLQGEAKNVLLGSKQIVITQKLANTLFGNVESLIGREVTVDSLGGTFRISGVCEAPARNSHIQFDALFSIKSYEALTLGGWMANSVFTYARLQDGTSPETVTSKLEEITNRELDAVLKRGTGKTLGEFKASGAEYRYFLYPIGKTYAHTPDIANDMQPKNDLVYVYIFVSLGFLIMVICTSNFLNLTTAQSINRSKEIGLRVALGSDRRMLMLQFLIETAIYISAALVISVLMVAIALPLINNLLDKSMSMDVIFSPVIFLPLVFFIAAIALITALYPVWFTSRQASFSVLRDFRRASVRNKRINQVLVILQFAIMFIISVATGHVFMQTHYLKGRSKGINEYDVVVLKEVRLLYEKQGPFIDDLLRDPMVINVSKTGETLPELTGNLLFRSLSDGHDYFLAVLFGDSNFKEVLQFEMVDGKYFSGQKNLQREAIVNEAAAREHNLQIGRRIINISMGTKDTLKIIGIVKDFRFENYQRRIRPLIILGTEEGNNLLIRYKGERKSIEDGIGNAWTKYAGNRKFELEYLEDSYADLLSKEMRAQQLFTLFTIIILLVSLIGLNAISLMNAEYRVKEIAIRKVMGADTFSLIRLLTRESSGYIIIAFMVSLYPAYYLIDTWLRDFDDHVAVSFIVFLIAGITGYAISISTVAYVSLKASNTNPVNLLRYE